MTGTFNDWMKRFMKEWNVLWKTGTFYLKLERLMKDWNVSWKTGTFYSQVSRGSASGRAGQFTKTADKNVYVRPLFLPPQPLASSQASCGRRLHHFMNNQNTWSTTQKFHSQTGTHCDWLERLKINRSYLKSAGMFYEWMMSPTVVPWQGDLPHFS